MEIIWCISSTSSQCCCCCCRRRGHSVFISVFFFLFFSLLICCWRIYHCQWNFYLAAKCSVTKKIEHLWVKMKSLGWTRFHGLRRFVNGHKFAVWIDYFGVWLACSCISWYQLLFFNENENLVHKKRRKKKCIYPFKWWSLFLSSVSLLNMDFDSSSGRVTINGFSWNTIKFLFSALCIVC